jgi:hypothetical protein
MNKLSELNVTLVEVCIKNGALWLLHIYSARTLTYAGVGNRSEQEGMGIDFKCMQKHVSGRVHHSRVQYSSLPSILHHTAILLPNLIVGFAVK